MSWIAFWLIYKADAPPCSTQSKTCEAEQRVRNAETGLRVENESMPIIDASKGAAKP